VITTGKQIRDQVVKKFVDIHTMLILIVDALTSFLQHFEVNKEFLQDISIFQTFTKHLADLESLHEEFLNK